MTVKLVATRQMMYATRRLVAGQPFEASPRDAKILKALKRAVDAPAEEPPKPQAPPPPSPPEPQPTVTDSSDEPTRQPDEIDGLRAAYETRFGKAPDRRWGAARLKEELAKPVED